VGNLRGASVIDCLVESTHIREAAKQMNLKPFSIELDSSSSEQKVQAVIWILDWLSSQTPQNFHSLLTNPTKVVYSEMPLAGVVPQESEEILNVTSTDILLWRVPYSEPGSQRLERLTFGTVQKFLIGVIWPRLSERVSVRCLEAEANLPSEGKELLQRSLKLKSEEESLFIRDMKRLLKDSPLHDQLFEAVMNEDLKRLADFAEPGMVAQTLVENGDIQQYVESVQEGHPLSMEVWKSQLLHQLRIGYAGDDWGKIDRWKSGELVEVEEGLQLCLNKIDSYAHSFYEASFSEFANSESIKMIEEKVFGVPHTVLSRLSV